MSPSQNSSLLKKPLDTTAVQWAMIIIFVLVSALVVCHETTMFRNQSPIKPLRVISAQQNVVTDGAYVYYNDQIIYGADPATFRLLNSDSGYAVDKKHAYYDGDVLPLADPATFSLINSDYAKDASSAYYDGSPVQGSDAKTFVVLDNTNADGMYAKDSQQVYYDGDTIPGADPATFVELGNAGYAKDANAVYYYGQNIIGADPATFVIASTDSNYDARDKNHTYSAGEIYTGNPSSSAAPQN